MVPFPIRLRFYPCSDHAICVVRWMRRAFCISFMHGRNHEELACMHFPKSRQIDPTPIQVVQYHRKTFLAIVQTYAFEDPHCTIYSETIIVCTKSTVYPRNILRE